MTKAIITIDDDDEGAPDGFSVAIEFDPPPPDTKAERASTNTPYAARIALLMMQLLKQEMGEPDYSDDDTIQ